MESPNTSERTNRRILAGSLLPIIFLLFLAALTYPGILTGGVILPTDWLYEAFYPWKSMAPSAVRALLHGPEQIADLPVPVAESPGAVRIGHPERSHLVEYLAPNSVFNSLPRQRSSPHLRPDDRLVTIDRVLHHASLGVA